MMKSPVKILRRQVKWQDLYFYKKTVVLDQLTFVFCQRFLPKYGDRTVDQMVQAARSGKQNIVEGFADGVTSTEMELKLLNVARASLKELEEDYAKKDTELKEFIDRVYGRTGELITENEQVSAPIISLIKKAVTEIALQEGYDMVVDRATGAVLFWKDENDLTKKVLDYLNSH